MPYRIDIRSASNETFDRLVELGALDAEPSGTGEIAALMPDTIAPEQVAAAIGISDISVSGAIGRDDESVWILRRRAIQIAGLRIVPAESDAPGGALRLLDTAAFGTGLHPTTAMCLEALEEIVDTSHPDTVLDIGTGSGVLALAALMMGVSQAVGVDIDEEALRVAAANARINACGERLRLAHGGPEAISGTWPLVVANILAAPLLEMAPTLVRRVGHQGSLVLSGISWSLEADVSRAYRHLGMRVGSVETRAGWVTLALRASW